MDYRNTGTDGIKESINDGEGASALPASIPDRDGRTGPANLRICARGHWPQRIRVETAFSLLTRVCHLKRAAHRAWLACDTSTGGSITASATAPRLTTSPITFEESILWRPAA